MAKKTEPHPDPFFTIRVKKKDGCPTLSGLCVGYERGNWRAAQFADHIIEWLPEFALSWSERKSMRHQNSVKLLRRATASVYTTKKFHKRGEFGELFLHAAIRQVFKSIPAISKIYYKDSHNNTVKGFDAVHVVATGKELELWLGEAKFYSSYRRAVNAVVREIKDHTTSRYLRGEFALIVNKIDPKWTHSTELQKLMSPNVSLDDVFKRICIPVLLTYDSECVRSHVDCGEKYVDAFKQEMRRNYTIFARRKFPSDIHIHLFLLPLHTKKQLIHELDTRLKQWQPI